MNLGNFSLSNLRQRDIALIVIVLTVLLGVAWFFYMYQPTGERIDELQVQIDQLNADIVRGETARDNIATLRAELERAQVERSAFLAELPRESEIASLLNQLRLGADAAEVQFESVNQSGGAGEQIQDVRPIGFSVSTQGEYPETMSFLNILESLQRFTKIRQVGLNVEDDGIDNPNLNATYDFTVYVYTGSAADDPVGGDQ